jgi:hypothetical protein
MTTVGSVRFIDVAAVGDTGAGAQPIVDMGAYETPNRVWLPMVVRGVP